ncbi:MAG: amidohydrolase family protein [Bdellovibrionales bacterium]|nr:amidohydrolase family protein [Bdellovibrionales bacterium]
MRIDACFDSHVHWAATGEFSQRLRLDGLKSAADIARLTPEAHHYRGEWLLGFGWDDNGWSERPHRRVLDTWMPERPVALSRCDGHSLWLNSEALKRAGLSKSSSDPQGGRLERDHDGELTGVVLDQAAEEVEKHIPAISPFEMRRYLLKAMQIFNEAGFTHIRDMTCDERQWNEAMRLDQSGVLTLAVEEYFWLKLVSDLDAQLELCERARKEQTNNLRVMGLKLFLDGALGSEGAWLSRCYHGSDNKGLILWEKPALTETLRRAWEKGLHVAIHAIGDEAADYVMNIAHELKAAGHEGALDIEHAELVRPETIEKMKGMNVRCHLQPSHWLSDQRWLQQKIGDLTAHAFPWRRLQEQAIPFDFGSDAPIEPASLARTFQALRDSAEAGIPRLLGSPASYMGHSDLSWAPNSFTLLQDEKPKQVVFRGEHIL